MASTLPTTGAPPLNPARRPQRLFGKVQTAMKAVDKRLKDDKYTGVYAYLSDDDFRLFRNSVRKKIRREYDANFESWPQGVAHDYVSDAKRIILETIHENWDALFASPADHDECLFTELVFPEFYN